MVCTRQRRLAQVFVLVLALELALMCCAFVHLSDHACTDHTRCAICACARAGLRRAAVAATAAAALGAVPIIHSEAHPRERFIAPDSPVLRKVRLND